MTSSNHTSPLPASPRLSLTLSLFASFAHTFATIAADRRSQSPRQPPFNSDWMGYGGAAIFAALERGHVLERSFCGVRNHVHSCHLRSLAGKDNESSYGESKEYFSHSLFLVFCNRLMTSAVSAGALLASKKALDPVAPVYKYCLVSVTNILTTTCQYEALKYVSFPVQTLAKCAKMIPVMLWSSVILQKIYKAQDYLLAVLVMLGCALFILYPAAGDISPYNRGRESTIWGVLLMIGYLGFDGFTSTFQDKLFKGYDMEIHNQIFYTTLCSCILSLTGLILQGHLLNAIDFVARHHDCFFDIVLLSTVATTSQFFISYTIRTFGALVFATIMTTRQLVSILLSCIWFAHPVSWEQCIGAVIVFGSLYAKSYLGNKAPKKPTVEGRLENGDSIPLNLKDSQ